MIYYFCPCFVVWGQKEGFRCACAKGSFLGFLKDLGLGQRETLGVKAGEERERIRECKRTTWEEGGRWRAPISRRRRRR